MRYAHPNNNDQCDGAPETRQPIHPSARIDPNRAAAHVAAVVFVSSLMGLPIGRKRGHDMGRPPEGAPMICDLPPWGGIRLFERILLSAYVGAAAEDLVTLTKEEDDALVADMQNDAEQNPRSPTYGRKVPRTIDELSVEYERALKSEARALVEEYREPISRLAETLVNMSGLAVWADRLGRSVPVAPDQRDGRPRRGDGDAP